MTVPIKYPKTVLIYDPDGRHLGTALLDGDAYVFALTDEIKEFVANTEQFNAEPKFGLKKSESNEEPAFETAENVRIVLTRIS